MEGWSQRSRATQQRSYFVQEMPPLSMPGRRRAWGSWNGMPLTLPCTVCTNPDWYSAAEALAASSLLKLALPLESRWNRVPGGKAELLASGRSEPPGSFTPQGGTTSRLRYGLYFLRSEGGHLGELERRRRGAGAGRGKSRRLGGQGCLRRPVVVVVVVGVIARLRLLVRRLQVRCARAGLLEERVAGVLAKVVFNRGDAVGGDADAWKYLHLPGGGGGPPNTAVTKVVVVSAKSPAARHKQAARARSSEAGRITAGS